MYLISSQAKLLARVVRSGHVHSSRSRSLLSLLGQALVPTALEDTGQDTDVQGLWFLARWPLPSRGDWRAATTPSFRPTKTLLCCSHHPGQSCPDLFVTRSLAFSRFPLQCHFPDHLTTPSFPCFISLHSSQNRPTEYVFVDEFADCVWKDVTSGRARASYFGH